MHLIRVLLRYAFTNFCLTWLVISILSRPAAYGPVDALFPNQTSKSINRILLLTAHPDDECMFFGPTISSLSKHSNIFLHSLCLSIGNSEGLGHIRKHELVASLNVLGIPPSRAQVLDHSNLRDNITETWDADLIAKVVNDFINQHDINTIITFDEKGISGHPNHISLPRGIQRLLLTNANAAAAITNHLHLRRPLRLFTLTTVPLTRKYTSALAHLISKFQHHIHICIPKNVLSIFSPFFILDRTNSSGDNNEAKDSQGNSPPASVLDSITLVSSLPVYIRTLNAMLQHRSQLVWFRWLYMAFSRYMWVNNLVEVPVRHVTMNEFRLNQQNNGIEL